MAAGEVFDSANMATEITLAVEPEQPLEAAVPDEQSAPYAV